MARTETQLGVLTACGTAYTQVDSDIAASTTFNLHLNVTNRIASTAKLRAYVADGSWTSGEPAGTAVKAAIAYVLPIAPGEVVQISGIVMATSPSRYLPSTAMQRARQASLPDTAVLEARLAQAVQGLPVRAQLFTPFIADVAAARRQPLLETAALEKTTMAMAVAALLIQKDDHSSALLPLTAPADVSTNADRIRAALSATGLPNVLFVDMKAESDRLYSGYLHEAIQLSLSGLVAIIGLLLLVFRSPIRVLRIIAPLAAAVITVTAGLALFKTPRRLRRLRSPSRWSPGSRDTRSGVVIERE